MEKEKVFKELGRCVTEYDVTGAEKAAHHAIELDINPMDGIGALIKAIRIVGDKFGSGEAFLPELIGAADGLKKALAVFEAEILKKGGEREYSGRIVIGTVAGDLHTIGKSILSALLTANGYSVKDLGIDVSTEKFLGSVKEHKPDILAMSALLTTTAPEAKKVIEALEEAELRDKVKVILGGGAITAEYAKAIGTDGYSETAPGAVTLVKDLINN